jgi:enoyl-CoA hydratase/carnithine racemase
MSDLLYDVKDKVATITLNRPDKLNAFTRDMIDGWARSLGQAQADDNVNVVIVTGAGRAFCAGFDLDDAEKLADLGAIGMLHQQELAARAMHAIRATPVPVIAAVNGAAAGGGMALALAADIRIGAPGARFNAAFVRIGLSAGDLGTSWLMPRLVGAGRAADIVYSGRIVEADEAERIGLLNRVVPAEALLDEALAMAAQIATNSPGGVELSKRALQANMEISSYAAALELENRGQALLTRGADMPEALRAFKERRQPQFTGQ